MSDEKKIVVLVVATNVKFRRKRNFLWKKNKPLRLNVLSFILFFIYVSAHI